VLTPSPNEVLKFMEHHLFVLFSHFDVFFFLFLSGDQESSPITKKEGKGVVCSLEESEYPQSQHNPS
jgi:hypothetical protein